MVSETYSSFHSKTKKCSRPSSHFCCVLPLSQLPWSGCREVGLRYTNHATGGHASTIFVKTFNESSVRMVKSRDSSVGIAPVYRLDDRGSRVRFPEGAGNICLHHRDQNGSGAHPTSYPMGTRDSFPGGRAAGA
jgi:hypothetical protein